MTIEEQLRRAAIASGASILNLCERSGLRYNSLHGFIRGTKTLTMTSANKLAKVLNLELRPIKKRKGA